MNFIFVTENKKLRRKIATLQRTCHRQQEKIIILQKFKRKAVSKKFEKETAIKALEKSFSSPQARILVHEKKQARKWSKDNIAEGLLLRSFSRRAYNFLREKKKLPLPSESTLRNWVRHFNCGPGVQLDSSNILKSKIESENSSLCKLGVLAFDEMEVSKCFEFDKETDEIIGPHKKVQVKNLL